MTLFILDLSAIAIIAAHDITKYRYKTIKSPECHIHKVQMLTEVMVVRYGRPRIKYPDLAYASIQYFPNYRYSSYLGCAVKTPIRKVRRDWYCPQCRIAFCNWVDHR